MPPRVRIGACGCGHPWTQPAMAVELVADRLVVVRAGLVLLEPVLLGGRQRAALERERPFRRARVVLRLVDPHPPGPAQPTPSRPLSVLLLGSFSLRNERANLAFETRAGFSVIFGKRRS